MTVGQDAVVKALIALDRAEKKFTTYAQLHRGRSTAKNDDHYVKAVSNYGLATMCGDALEQLKLAFPYEASNA